MKCWSLECDISERERLRLSLFFLDAHSVPRNHVRYISWAAHLVAGRAGGEQRRQHEQQIPVRNRPHFGLYLQEGTDLGTIMETDIAADQVSRPSMRAFSLLGARRLALLARGRLNSEPVRARDLTQTPTPTPRLQLIQSGFLRPLVGRPLNPMACGRPTLAQHWR